MIGLALSLNRCINASDEARALAAIRRAGGTVLLSGLARNYFDSAGTTPATVDNPVGLVQGSVGSNNATQGTTGSKPTLRLGLVNQLLWSGDFTNAAWTKTEFALTANQPGPTGANDAALLTETATSGIHQILQTYAAPAAGPNTFAVVVKYAGKNLEGFGGNWNFPAVQVDLQTGVVSGAAASSVTIASVGNGYWLIARADTAPDTAVRSYITRTSGSGATAGSGILLHRAAIYQGTVTAQQIIAAGGIPLTTTAPASSALGNYWWQFDPAAPGDFFSTGISTGNGGWVCAGVTFGGAADSIETVLGSGANASTIKGVWLARVGSATENTLWLATGNGTTRHIASKTDVPLRNTQRVVDGGWTATTCFVAVDGVESVNARSGDMTPPAASLQIGAVSGALPLSGSMSSTVICPTLPPPADRALIRAWVAKQQGQTL